MIGKEAVSMNRKPIELNYFRTYMFPGEFRGQDHEKIVCLLNIYYNDCLLNDLEMRKIYFEVFVFHVLLTVNILTCLFEMLERNTLLKHLISLKLYNKDSTFVLFSNHFL